MPAMYATAKKRYRPEPDALRTVGRAHPAKSTTSSPSRTLNCDTPRCPDSVTKRVHPPRYGLNLITPSKNSWNPSAKDEYGQVSSPLTTASLIVSRQLQNHVAISSAKSGDSLVSRGAIHDILWMVEKLAPLNSSSPLLVWASRCRSTLLSPVARASS